LSKITEVEHLKQKSPRISSQAFFLVAGAGLEFATANFQPTIRHGEL